MIECPNCHAIVESEASACLTCGFDLTSSENRVDEIFEEVFLLMLKKGFRVKP